MSPRIMQPTREDLLRRRQQLLDEAETTRAQLARRAEAGLLQGDEFDLWDEIESIEFLLGDGDG